MTEEQTDFLDAIKTITPMRMMTRDATYVIRMACEIDADLNGIVSQIGPHGITQIAQTVESTPAHQWVKKLARSLNQPIGPYDATTFYENLANVLEDALTGRITRPTTVEGLKLAIVNDYVANVASA